MSEGSYNLRPKLITHVSSSVPTMPEWVTALEAAVLTGASETDVLEAVRSGRITAAPISLGRGGNGVLMVRLRDVQALVETAAPSAPQVTVTLPPAPPQTPVAEPLAPSSNGVAAFDPSTVWAEPSPPAIVEPPPVDPAPIAVAPVAPAPVVQPPVAPAPVVQLPVAPAPVSAPPALTLAPAPAEPGIAGPGRTPLPSTIWDEPTAQPAAVPVRVRREPTRPRLRNPKTLTAAILAVLLLGAAVYVARPGTLGKPKPPPAGSLGAAPPSVVWAMPTAHGVQLAVVGLPKNGTGIALALPSATHVILPAGDISTIGASAGSGPRAQAVAQNILLKRVGHYLVSTPASLAQLVDDLGGLDIGTEAPFTFGGHRIEAGTVQMTGAMALAYLSQATADDVTGRWEDVIAAVLLAPSEAADWSTVGASDDLSVVSRLLASSRGATVYEMPTAPAVGGGDDVDRDALGSMLDRFGSSLGDITRVVVVNGSGAPGLGTLIDGRLAPYGFSVVTSENASHFDVRRTQVVASGDENVAAATQARKILGVGTVNVSDQPTSLSDVTIIVGKDFSN
jgi:LytR cell envelope-related transcriptional attenuator